MRARVHGTVQGVGFRPFVYRLALEEELAGFVLNDEHGVLLEVEGGDDAVQRFLRRLEGEPPQLAQIESVATERLAPADDRGFRIIASARGGVPDAPITADSATCPDCLAELQDPRDRRYRYPFINCTNCGPRFTIIRGVPYDRPLTTMAAFPMCDECRREYEDPGNRRFHAQPNACPRCGPRAWLARADGSPLELPGARDAIDGAARRLADGLIVAIKGIGGFHLACDATNERAVAALRTRKQREDKPFALMVASPEAAQELVTISEQERRLLQSAERPIVLAGRRHGAPIAASVAPGAPELGVMLPYTPIHHLLLGDYGHHVAAGGVRAAGLVMTSGNVSDEPIAYEDADAMQRLARIADLFLLHDRAIHARTDDSVARVLTIAGRSRTALIRRSRGYVPRHLELPLVAPQPILACGAQQKNTFCLARRERAWVSHHIGDLEHFAAYESFRTGVDHFQELFAAEPALIAHDLHPGYLSTQYALERDGVEHLGVQHHHAHLASCLAEHGVEGPAVGAIFDGTGYGTDGTVWGGEFLIGDLGGFERAGSLRPVPLPGAAAAIRQPWRMAFAWLRSSSDSIPQMPLALAGSVDDRQWLAMDRVAGDERLSPRTTSMGRLFDAVGALCGLAPRTTYEGQAAVELEAAATNSADRGSYELQVVSGDAAGLTLDPRAMLLEIDRDIGAGLPIPTVAARFHAAVAEATIRACVTIAGARRLDTVVLSGGVFQNRLLITAVADGLARAGLRVLSPELLPANDGGISFGQAAIAAAHMSGDLS